MVVYVETNFVLEIAFKQREAVAARRILELAAESKVDLCIPSFSISEAVNAVTNLSKTGTTLAEIIDLMAPGLQRTFRIHIHNQHRKRLADSALEIARDSEIKSRRVKTVMRKILACAKTIEMTEKLVKDGMAAERSYELRFPDALVFASVKHHARSNRSVAKFFLTRDKKNFDQPDVLRILARRGVTVYWSFEEGVTVIEAAIAP